MSKHGSPGGLAARGPPQAPAPLPSFPQAAATKPEPSGKRRDWPPFPDSSRGGEGSREAGSPARRPSVPWVFAGPAEVHTAGQAAPAREQENKVGSGHRLLTAAALPGGLLLTTPGGTGSGPGHVLSCGSATSLLPSVKGKNAGTENGGPGLATNLLRVLGSLTDSRRFHRNQRSRKTSGVVRKDEGGYHPNFTKGGQGSRRPCLSRVWALGDTAAGAATPWAGLQGPHVPPNPKPAWPVAL